MKLIHALIGVALTAAISQADISYTPVTVGATESAAKLYNFLAVNYGSKTVSGIQTGELNFTGNITEQPDLKSVDSVSNKFPALVGFDFLFANGKNANDNWYKEYTNKTISLAVELWKNGGIPAFSWHWKDPSDSVDAFYVQGAAESYTTFDFTKAFKTGTTEWDTTTDTYKQIVADIDEISALFKTLQDSGAAAIFRPLHECGGAWFWWNTKPAAYYAALYRLIYTRITETGNIKNLVWVWNPQTPIFNQAEWNPGSTYYDVISVDIYNTAFNYESNASAFKNMVTNFGTGKIFALSENGPIPDASLMQADSAIWAWYMPWYQSWSGNFVSQTKNTVWKANL
ncbi:MAG: beta-mannosidase, partial [Fibrobacter sp.]|nr:beta-mannosidase [Fibrobacter sp.]